MQVKVKLDSVVKQGNYSKFSLPFNRWIRGPVKEKIAIENYNNLFIAIQNYMFPSLPSVLDFQSSVGAAGSARLPSRARTCSLGAGDGEERRGWGQSCGSCMDAEAWMGQQAAAAS